MGPLQRELWRALPETVTLYRGGYAKTDGALDRVACATRGLFWTPDPEYAAYYVQKRNGQSFAPIVKDAVAALPLHLGGMSRIGYTPKTLVASPFLVRAEVPRELVLVYWIKDYGVELIVDSDRLDATMIADITPENIIPAISWAA